MQKFQSDLFNMLEARILELGFDFERADGSGGDSSQLGDTLLFLLPITEDDDRALTDLRFIQIDDERFCIQVFLTIFNNLEDGYDELEKALPALNLYTRFGSYGMLKAQRQFWNKYVFAIRELDLTDGPEGVAVALLDVLDLIREQNTAIYETVAALASGSMTYQEAIQSGLI